MRDILDVLIAAGGIWCGWWACDIHHTSEQRYRRLDRLPVYPVGEPPSNVLSIVEDDGDGLLS